MQWVSVKDRLPDIKTYVLCAIIDDFPSQYKVPEFFKVSFWYDANEGMRTLYPNEEFPVAVSWNATFLKVTHWMPLPQQPKDQ